MNHWHLQDNASAYVVGMFSGLATVLTETSVAAIGGRLALGAATALVTGFAYRLGSWGASKVIARVAGTRAPVTGDSDPPPHNGEG